MLSKNILSSIILVATFTSSAIGASISTIKANAPITCPNPVLTSTEYIGEGKNVLAESYNCFNAPQSQTVIKRQSSDPTNVCGATCNTNCFTPSGGGPNPYDCSVIADALLYDGQNVGPLFTVPPASNASVVVMSYQSCETFFVNQASSNLTYCRSDWSTLVNYVAFNCQSTQNAHGGNCVASDQRWFIHLVFHTNAHGYVESLTVDGTTYIGNIPHVTSFASPIRAVDDITPVKGASNRDLNCGLNAQKAQMVVDAKPGSELSFNWDSGENTTPWPHNIGPVVNYIAACTNTTCDQFDAINARWFKIDQAGKIPGSDTWYQNDIMQDNTYTTHLPTSLPPGDYLVRHEIIALHLGNEFGGAEFYPSCSQIRVSGNSTTPLPPDSELVSFPGAYNDNDPGIFVPTIFNPGANYTSFPGPAIISPFFAGSSGGVLITGKAPTTTTMELPGPSQTPVPFTNVKLGVIASISVPGAPSASTAPTSTTPNSSSSLPASSVVESLGKPSVSPSCKKAKKRNVLVDAVNERVKRNATLKPIKREDRPKVLSRIMAKSHVVARG